MRKLTLLFLMLSLAMLPDGNAQNKKVIGNISKEICNCLENYKNLKEIGEMEIAMENCTMKSSMKNMDIIKKELSIDLTAGEESGRQFGEIIAYEMVNSCPTFIKFITAIATDFNYENDSTTNFNESSFLNPDLVPYESYSTDTMQLNSKLCHTIKNATFLYQSENSEKLDYFVLSKNKCIEYHEDKKYISQYSIKWKKNCRFIAKLIESTNPQINNLLSKGDKVAYQFIGIYGDIAYLKIDFKGFSKTFKLSISKP